MLTREKTMLIIKYAQATTTVSSFENACEVVANLIDDPFPRDDVRFADVKSIAKRYLREATGKR